MPVRFLTDKDAVVQYTKQDLTEEQKAQARENIGVGAGSDVEPAEDDIPKVFFGGALPQTKDDTVMSFRYISKTMDISGYCKTKAQGNSSMNYPKKNQTVKLYRDAACTEKLKVDFKGWGKQNKFCFKANWIDLTHARNIVSARLWGDVVKSRANYETIPELLRTAPNQGAVDGFPVKVYTGGVYQGRYTINIPKDAWMANMDDELNTHCILCGENYESGCFRAAAKIDGTDWTDEVHDTVPILLKTWWNHAIDFVMTSSDEGFRTGLGMYFDVDSLIDYYLFGLASCGLDAFGKNQLYMTYNGQKWYATMYDMDSTWGLYWNGSKMLPTSYGRSDFEDMISGRQGNLLYMRLEQLFIEELQTRWAELKKGALSVENILNRFERFTDIAPAELVKEDYAGTTGGGKFTGIPSQSANHIQQIRAFVLDRLAWTDDYVAALGGQIFLYRLPEATTFDGADDFIDTGVKLFDTEKDFTILCEVNAPAQTTNGTIFHCIDESGSPWPGLCVMYSTGRKSFDLGGRHDGMRSAYEVFIEEGLQRYGIVVKAGVPKLIKIRSGDYGWTCALSESTFSACQQTLVLGAYQDASGGKGRFFKGTINSFAVYDYAMEDETVEAFVTEGLNDKELLYELAEPTTFDTAGKYINTEIRLFDQPRDFTIVMEAEPLDSSTQRSLYDCRNSLNNGLEKSGTYYMTNVGGGGFMGYLTATGTMAGSGTHNSAGAAKVAAVFEGGILKRTYCLSQDSESIVKRTITNGTYKAHSAPLLLGAVWGWDATVNTPQNVTVDRFEIYNRALTDAEVESALSR